MTQTTFERMFDHDCFLLQIKPCKSMQPEAETPDGIEEVKTTESSLMLQEICESSFRASTAADIPV